jgi:hypothetical protein
MIVQYKGIGVFIGQDDGIEFDMPVFLSEKVSEYSKVPCVSYAFGVHVFGIDLEVFPFFEHRLNAGIFAVGPCQAFVIGMKHEDILLAVAITGGREAKDKNKQQASRA